jgi:hypothetical protein
MRWVLRGFVPIVLPYCRHATTGQDGTALEISPTREIYATASPARERGSRREWVIGDGRLHDARGYRDLLGA